MKVEVDGRVCELKVKPEWTMRSVRRRALHLFCASLPDPQRVDFSDGEAFEIFDGKGGKIDPDSQCAAYGDGACIELRRRVPREVFVTRRERMPDERDSVTQRFVINSDRGVLKFYITVGLYPDGRVGEVFFRIDKEGGMITSVLDQWAIAMSIGLQYGIPLEVFIIKFENVRSDGGGMVEGCDLVKMCKSPVDCIARWLRARFLDVVSEEECPGEAGGLPETLDLFEHVPLSDNSCEAEPC